MARFQIGYAAPRECRLNAPPLYFRACLAGGGVHANVPTSLDEAQMDLFMMIAHGIDLVDIASTKRLLGDPTEQFLTQCFTDQERASAGAGLERAARLSGRFAVKEAVLKALGTGYGDGISFRDVETVLLDSGAPRIVMHGEALKRAQALGITGWLVSTSHEGNMAIASVIALGD